MNLSLIGYGGWVQSVSDKFTKSAKFCGGSPWKDTISNKYIDNLWSNRFNIPNQTYNSQ